MTTTHEISGEQFDALAAGYGGAATVATLRGGQLSKRLHLLQALLNTLEPEPAEKSGFAEAFALLTEVQDRAPDVVAEALLHPFVGRWAGLAVKRARNDMDADIGYLRGLAVSAAIRAGVETAACVPAVDGWALLPSLGRARIAGPELAAGALPADLTAETADWQPVRTICVTAGGRELRVQLDDLDPYRHVLDDAVAGRLPADDVPRWTDTIAGAWHLLASDHPPDYVDELAAGLHTVVPLAASSDNHPRSSSTSQAHGAVSLSTRDDPIWTALLMVHEFQHVKLAALLDMVELYDPNHDGLYHAPWRRDPRPLGALLHGVYAHLGVVDFWRVHRTVAHEPTAAHFQFALWRELTTLAMLQLIESDALTALGRRFVCGAAATLESWQRESVPSAIATTARRAALDNSEAWRNDTGMTPVHGCSPI
ncbi:HEXXH motif domain-containing protein [Actinoallomurus sp. NPDC052308]|uniref:HEXXH motif domain-containing protein n=1 Tax=Actinoallomurus sp. NPDC052308 TaxID=3155530 RepID=UPI003432A9C4